ncbi:MAG: hypothetical protein LBI34_01735 [Puniceicoccales bacterium]|nr:hypothetical protein [Puniceicoccales bacterium]
MESYDYQTDKLTAALKGHDGAAVYYNSKGVRCFAGPVPAGDNLKKITDDVVVVRLGAGHSGASMLWFVKDEKYVSLAKEINYRLVGSHRTTFRCLIGVEMEAVAFDAMPPPEPWSQHVLAKIGDGGFASAVMSICALVTFFANAMFSGATSWAPLGVSLVLLIAGLIIGAGSRFLYRQMVAPETGA